MQYNILNEFWKYTENQNTKISKKVLDWLDCDELGSIIIDDISKVFWLEKTYSMGFIPNYAFYYIKKWCKKRGYNYLYDVI